MKLVASHEGDMEDTYFFEEDVNSIFEKVFPKGECAMIAKNHGWRGLDGYRSNMKYRDGMSALSKCTSGDSHVRIYVGRNKEHGYHIAINTVHHDVPMWGTEWSYLVRKKYLSND